jgi:molecular chaperone GrpE
MGLIQTLASLRKRRSEEVSWMNTDASQAQAAGGPDKSQPSADTEVARLTQALAESEEKAKSHWDQYLRSLAELDNVRKRAQRDIEQAHRFGLEKLVAELLPVRDSLELAVQAQAADVASLQQGQEATLQLLTRALEKLGVTLISPQGAPFDPVRHEAMLAQESAQPADSVLQVLQVGYELNGRVLRPARVIVAKPADAPAPPAGDAAPAEGA